MLVSRRVIHDLNRESLERFFEALIVEHRSKQRNNLALDILLGHALAQLTLNAVQGGL